MQWLTEENAYLSIKGHYHTCLDPLIFTEEERGGGDAFCFFNVNFLSVNFPGRGKGPNPPRSTLALKHLDYYCFQNEDLFYNKEIN